MRLYVNACTHAPPNFVGDRQGDGVVMERKHVRSRAYAIARYMAKREGADPEKVKALGMEVDVAVVEAWLRGGGSGVQAWRGGRADIGAGVCSEVCGGG